MRRIILIDNIEINKIYSYKELCGIFKEECLAGNSKKAQLKNWSCYFEYEHPINKKTKKPSIQKYLITKIYNKAKSKIDRRVDNGAYKKYYDCVEPLLINEILHNSNMKTIKGHYRELGICSDLYQEINEDSRKRDIYLEENNISYYDYNIIKYKIESFVYRAISSTVKELSSNNIISVIDILYSTTSHSNHINITLEQYKEIETEVLNILNLNSIVNVFSNNIQNKFYWLVNRELKRKYNIEDVIKVKQFEVTDLDYVMNIDCSKECLQTSLTKLKNVLRDSILTSIKKTILKNNNTIISEVGKEVLLLKAIYDFELSSGHMDINDIKLIAERNVRVKIGKRDIYEANIEVFKKMLEDFL